MQNTESLDIVNRLQILLLRLKQDLTNLSIFTQQIEISSIKQKQNELQTGT